MAEILFVTWDGGGNVPPALGIAGELQSRGHGVRFLGHSRNRAQVSASGFPFEAYAHALPFSCLEANPPERMVEIFNDSGIGTDLVENARSARTDVVVVDCLLLAALAAARQAGLTYVPLEHLFDEYLREHWLRAPFGQAAEARGYAPYDALDSAALTLVASLAVLDPAARREQPANLVYSGPIVSVPAPRDLSSVEPLVLVSLSTYNFPGQREALQGILDAVDGLPARVVVTTGPAIDGSGLRVPANAEVHEYVDHDELMPKATLVFGHGGHATTMRALGHGLPLVVMPMHPLLDQTMVGTVVQEAGAGRLVTMGTAPEELRAVVSELLADGPHRAAAAQLAAAIAEARGPATAADEILRVVKNAESRG